MSIKIMNETMTINQESPLFTELALSEQASLSGGKGKDTSSLKMIKKSIIIIDSSIIGAGGGAGSGGAILGDSGDATGGSGVIISLK